MEQIPPVVEEYTEQSLSAIHHALRASRRRLVVSLVAYRAFSLSGLTTDDAHSPGSKPETVVTVRQVAKEIVAIEEGISIDHATGDPYHNVYTTLIQTHLPELDNIGAIKYDEDRKKIAPAGNLIVLSMVVAITSPVARLLFHNAMADLSDDEVMSLEGSTGD